MEAAAGSRVGTSDVAAIAASMRDPARFAVVFDRHYQEIWSYLTRRGGQALAEELASETFVRAFAARAGSVRSRLHRVRRHLQAAASAPAEVDGIDERSRS